MFDGCCVQVEVALRGDGSVIEEVEPKGKDGWQHTSQAVAVTNDVIVYVIAKEVFDKTVLAKESQKEVNKTNKNPDISWLKKEKRSNRVEVLIEAQSRMREEGMKAATGINWSLKDLGGADAAQHAKQVHKINQYKRALNLYDKCVSHASSGSTKG